MRLFLALLVWVPVCSLAMGLTAWQGRDASHLWVGLAIDAGVRAYVASGQAGVFKADGAVENFLCGERTEEQKKRESVIEE